MSYHTKHIWAPIHVVSITCPISDVRVCDIKVMIFFFLFSFGKLSFIIKGGGMDAFLIFFLRITCIYVNIFNTWNKGGGD